MSNVNVVPGDLHQAIQSTSINATFVQAGVEKMHVYGMRAFCVFAVAPARQRVQSGRYGFGVDFHLHFNPAPSRGSALGIAAIENAGSLRQTHGFPITVGELQIDIETTCQPIVEATPGVASINAHRRK